MCLAIPMKIVELKPGNMGVASIEGVNYDVDLSLLDDVRTGEYIIVHAGFAIEKLDEKDAKERIAMFKALAEQASQ